LGLRQIGKDPNREAVALAWQVGLGGLRGNFGAWKRLNDRLLESLPDDPRSRR